MKFPSPNDLPTIGIVLVATAAPMTALAQLEESAQSLNSNALTAMNAGKWEEALVLLTRCVERFDKVALQTYGPQFGVTWYRKGICEQRLKKWDEAIASFQKCYQSYPNQGDNLKGGGNLYNKRSLLRWAECLQGSENYAEALKMYEKFMQERDKDRDKFDPGLYYTCLAVCSMKTGKVQQGIENFETALKNRTRFNTPPGAVAYTMKALVEVAIEKKDEKILPGFVSRNRADLILTPAEMEPFSKLYLKLGGDCVSADMPAAGLALYQLVPSTDEMIVDIKSRIRALGSRAGVKEPQGMVDKKKLEESLARLEGDRRSGNPHEAVQLAAVAYLHEKGGNVQGAYASYQALEQFYPKSPKREDNLFHLVRTSSLVGEYRETEKHGSEFLKVFPQSKHVPDVQKLMLTSLFYGGEYETCIRVAKDLLPKLREGTKEHDVCLHVLGGSHYYTGAYDLAQPLLDEHVSKYPESQFAIASTYFQASNVARLQFWEKAGSLLDAFLAKYPEKENIYLPFVLYDRANTHFAMDQPDRAVERITQLRTEFPDAEVLDNAMNLLGNIQQNRGEGKEAEKSYRGALEIAQKLGHRNTEGESLLYLVGLLGDPSRAKQGDSRVKDALPFIDRFWKEHAEDSPFKARFAVAQVHSLEAAGRGKEAMDRLASVISSMAKGTNTDALEQAIHSYTEIYLKSHSPEQLKNHFYEFPDVSPKDKAANALLRTAIIGVFEDQIRSSTDDAEKRRAQATVGVLFNELKNDFDPKDLTPYTLIRTGDFLREKTSAPRQALPYYDEVLSRNDPEYRFAAQFGRASVLSTGSAAEMDEAIQSLNRVFADSQDKQQKERALYAIVQTQMAKRDYAAAAESAMKYLDREQGFGFTHYAPEVGLLLGQAFQARDMKEDAMARYMMVWNTYKGYVKVSAPALKEWILLCRERNRPANGESPSDAQGAYDAGWIYIDQTRRFFDRMPDDEKAAWKEVEALVQDLEVNPAVKPMEAQKVEKKK